MQVLTSKITGYSVKKDDGQAVPVVEEEVESSPTLMHENVSRPEMLLGSTYKIKTPLSEHALYLTINDVILDPGTEHEHRHPYEVFINSKNLDHFQWVVALTRVISAVFRKGGECGFLTEELRGVFDPQGGYYKPGGVFMPSLVAEIGTAIEDHLKAIGLVKGPELSEGQKKLIAEKRAMIEARDEAPASESKYPPGGQQCPKCMEPAMFKMDNCMTCLACADSKCG